MALGSKPQLAALSRWDAILFDLGGVLLNLDYSATIRAFERLAGRPLPGLYSRALQAGFFDRFERGEITATEFRSELRNALEARCSDPELDAAWNALLLDVPASRIQLLLELRASHRVHLLSNTNELHLNDFFSRFERDHGKAHGPFSSLFDKDYYSHHLGLRKPERAVFEHVLLTEGLEARRTLFIDDNWHNVEAARSCGLDAAWLDVPPAPGRGPQEAPSGLLPEFDGARDIHELFQRLGWEPVPR